MTIGCSGDDNESQNDNGKGGTGGAKSGAAGTAGTAGIAGGLLGGAGIPARVGVPFAKETTDHPAPPFVEGGDAPPAAPGATVSIGIDASQVVRKLPRTLWGNNAAVWNGSNLLSQTVRNRLTTAGVSILRFPGGSTSDQYHWDGVYPAYAKTKGWDVMSQSWAINTAGYLQLTQQLDLTRVITVNYAYSTYDATVSDGKVENAARLAADWVEYCNAPNDGSNPNGGTDWAAKRQSDGLGDPIKVSYWEVGNEIFGNWESGYDSVGSTYARNFNVIVDAMKAVDPTISIGLVVDPTTANSNWTKTVLSNPGTAERADFVSVHSYFGWWTSTAQATPTNLLASASQVAQLKSTLDGLVTANTTRTPEDLPYYMSEYNVTIPANPLQISLASGLFIAKVMGELARTGWAAASLWDVLNTWDTTSALGPGDLGFLSMNQPDVPNFTPRPSYFDFYFFSRNFGDRLLASTSSDAQVIAYASSFSGGGVGVVIINEAAESRSVSLAVTGATLTGKANLWILSGPTLEGAQVTLNGTGNGYVAGGPLPEAVVPYALTTSASGTVSVDVPAASVTSLVLY